MIKKMFDQIQVMIAYHIKKYLEKKISLINVDTFQHNHLLFLTLLQYEVRATYNTLNIGSLWNKASWKSTLYSLIGTRFNINHLGNTYEIPYNKLSITQKIEKMVLEWNKQLIKATDNSIHGYITSGGTEGNLFLMWMGRDQLRINGQDPVLLISKFSHYSIKKAGRILDLETRILSTDTQKVAIDLRAFKKKLLSMCRQGQYSFLLPITIGYSSTGTSDDLDRIVAAIELIKQKYPKLVCFIWVDAAAQGLPRAFLDDTFRPFSHPLVAGYIVDFHKYGHTSVPSGIVLYREQNISAIKESIAYLDEEDATLLGSRPGSSALAIWAEITSKTTKQWRQHFQYLEQKKTHYIKYINDNLPDARVISSPYSLTFAIEINQSFPKLSKRTEEKFSLVECNIDGLIHYKFHINN